MNSARKMMMAATAAAVLCLMGGCGNQSRKTLNRAEAAETSPTQALAQALAHAAEAAASTTTAATSQTTVTTTQTTATTTQTTAMTTAATSSTTIEQTSTTTTEEAENFELTDEEVVNKMRDFFSERGYNDAQIAGIVGNAEIESGLEPSRGVQGGGFGLFQLMDCARRQEMLAEFDDQGVGKYATSDYWAFDASNFDTEADFNTFMDVMLDYTMNPDDPTWMEELHAATSPEEAAEIFLVHYERAVNGGSPIEYYSAYAGRYYQGTSSRREAARRWYNYFTS